MVVFWKSWVTLYVLPLTLSHSASAGKREPPLRLWWALMLLAKCLQFSLLGPWGRLYFLVSLQMGRLALPNGLWDKCWDEHLMAGVRLTGVLFSLSHGRHCQCWLLHQPEPLRNCEVQGLCHPTVAMEYEQETSFCFFFYLLRSWALCYWNPSR